ncbi:hypothetical protein [Desulfovibrio cuneatus]|uniref:hypothetical protein n=1 Tax=Desulfovibrio cuneatus TaxID=159728 RepID=UPI0003FB3501|nr:hypothetical protein [Desulfovibrio cuneatus]
MTQGIQAFLPYAAPIPGPAGWIEVLSFITFTAHLLLMNALVGTLLLAVLRWRSPHAAVRQNLEDSLPMLPKGVALTVNLAVPPLLFLQVLYGRFFYSGSIIQSVWWLGIMLLVMMAYYGLYLAAAKENGRRFVLGIATCLLLLTAFILTANAALVLNPQVWPNWLPERASALLLAGAGTVVPRFLHSLLACMAVGGLCLAGLATLRQNKGIAGQEPAITQGLAWFRHATLGQLAVGTWYFFSLTPQQQHFLLTTPAIHALYTFLGLGMGLGVWLSLRAKVWQTVGVAAFLVATMVAVRALLRQFVLMGVQAGSMPPEYAVPPSVLVLFLVSVLGTFAGIFWALRLCARAYSTPSAAQPQHTKEA